MLRLAAAAILAAAALPFSPPATPGVRAAGAITVNDAGDAATGSGCTLRAAILAANTNAAVAGCTAGSPGLDSIRFGSSMTINVLTDLPLITEPIDIDGGGTPGGSYPITINGAGGSAVNGLVISGSAGGSTIKGLVIQGFSSEAVSIQNGSNGNTIQANMIGTDASGTTARPNNVGVIIHSARNNIIGGSSPSLRNVISGNSLAGIEVSGSGSDAGGNIIRGNYIGPAAGGASLLDHTQGAGVYITDAGGSDLSSGNMIGGPSAADGNVISGNRVNVKIEASGSFVSGSTFNTIQNNYIGLDATGMIILRATNAEAGVEIDGEWGPASGTLIKSNVISGNGTNGIYIHGGSHGGSAANNNIQANKIGVAADGTSQIPNQRDGILTNGAANTTISGGNVIRFNLRYGVNIIGGAGNNVSGDNTVSDNALGQVVGGQQPVVTTPSATLSTITASRQTAPSDGTTAVTVTVTLRDGSGNPVSGKNVSVSSSRNSGGGVDAIGAASGASDAAGVVTFPITSRTAGTATITAADTTDSISLAAGVQVTFSISPANSTITASPASVAADGRTPIMLTVTLKDGLGNPVSGKQLTVSSSRGAADTITPATTSSDDNGSAAVAVTSSTSGTATFTAATSDGIAVSASAQGTFTTVFSGPANLAFSLLAQPARGAAGFPLGFSPVVVITQQGGSSQPVAGDNSTVITVRIKPGTGSASATLSCSQGLTRTVVQGTATFGSCTIDRVGSGYVLEATTTTPGVTGAETAAFNVTWGGDADGSGAVDVVDFSRLVAGYGRQFGDAGFDAAVDFNGDNATDVTDFSILLARFGTRQP